MGERRKTKPGSRSDMTERQGTGGRERKKAISHSPRSGTAQVCFRVCVQCEACGQEYVYMDSQRAELKGQPLSAFIARFTDSDQPAVKPKSCPHCGYLQKWMSGSWVESRRDALATAMGALGVLIVTFTIDLERPGDLGSFRVEPGELVGC